MAEIKISGRMAVKTLKKQMKEAYGVTLRVYDGNRFADENATLASIRKGDSKGGVVAVNGHMLVGNFEKAIMENYGIKIQIANADDSKLSDNNISLTAAGKTTTRKAVKKEKTVTSKTDKGENSASLLDIEVWDEEKKTCIVNGVTDEKATNIEIPSTMEIEGKVYKVTKIGDYAFEDCKNLTSVTIPDSVTKIGSWAFSNCSSIESVTIPDSVTEIDPGAFSGCSSLKHITIPDSVTKIHCKAFDDCPFEPGLFLYDNGGKCYGWVGDKSKCIDVIIPDSVSVIGENAFSCCDNLTGVTIPDSVTVIDAAAFECCSSLECVSIPASVTEIERGAFLGCVSLMEVAIPDSITRIDSFTFKGCRSLVSISIPNSVERIGDAAFSHCVSLESVTIPDSVLEIGELAFDRCLSLKSLSIPNSVVKIEENAFEDCRSLEDVSLPDMLTEISRFTFSGCRSLKNIVIPADMDYIGYHAFFNCGLDSITIHGEKLKIPGLLIYANGTQCYGWIGDTDQCISVTIPDSVTAIGEGAFCGCELTSVTIPASVTEIGAYAFAHCENLTSVTIPDSVTEIGNRAFSDCASLESVTILGSDVDIWCGAFDDCENLKTVKISKDLEVDDDVFDEGVEIIRE